MSAQRTRLLELAASVADGTVDIDWTQLDASVQDEEDRQLLEDLRVLAGVAQLHRSDPAAASGLTESRTVRGRVVGRIGPVLTDTDAPTVEERVLPPPSLSPMGRWGHLDLIEQIGQGSFGNVYRARDTRLDRDVALKLLRKGRQTAELAEKVLHEGRILARVRHRNVVTVFGVEEQEGRIGLWMEYIRGRTLEQLLRSTGPFGAREAALIGQELCRALAAVHKAGLVHRDIKTQNVMREEGGRLVLMDFGAGEYVQAGGTAPTGRLTGTPLYLAPELLRGGEATVRSDMYGLGVLLFHLVTTQYPVSASSLDDLRQAHREGRRLRLHDARPDLADDFARVVERACHPDPDRRHMSAGALQEALARSLGLDSTITVDRDAIAAALAASAAEAPVPAVANAPARWTFRWWHVAFVGVALGAVLVALLAWLLPREAAPILQRATAVKPIVAVRPFVSAGGAFDPLTFAVASSLGARLSASPEVRVTSADAVAALNDADTASASIMATLQSDALIELLPVRQVSGGYQANARLIMAGALPVSLPTIGPTATLDGLSDALASALAAPLRLNAETLHGASPASTRANPEALELYARGLRQSATESPGGTAQACQSFKAAMTADPEFAGAHARWAQCLLTQYRFGVLPARSAFEYARTAASMALARDADSADARAVLADLHAEEHDWVRAESEFHEALARDSSNVYARSRYAMLLAGRGRTAESVEQLTEALRASPLSSTVKGYRAMSLHYAGRDEEALDMFQQLRGVDMSLESALVGQCRIFVVVGKFEEALSTCRQLLTRRGGHDAFSEAQLAAALGRLDRHPESARQLALLRGAYDAAPDNERPNLAFFLATAYAGLEQVDQVFPWLEVAARGGSSRLAYLRVDPRFAVARSDPRWAQILTTYESRP
ncbi:MAG: protein kinase [Acidobacteria bacterium]|nr:protein kinase [Acidobacteriota bacterium]